MNPPPCSGLIPLICWSPSPPRSLWPVTRVQVRPSADCHTAASFSPTDVVEPAATRRPPFGLPAMALIDCAPVPRRSVWGSAGTHGSWTPSGGLGAFVVFTGVGDVDGFFDGFVECLDDGLV